MLHRSACRGNDAKGRLRVLRQDLDAAQQHIFQAWREIGAGVALAYGGEQFLGEECIATGAPKDLLHQIRCRTAAHTALQQLCDLVTIEAIDIQPVNSLAAVQFGEEGTDRMAAVQVVGAVGQPRSNAVRRLRTKKVSKSRVERSAQCKSSITNTVGERFAKRSSRPRKASNSLA